MHDAFYQSILEETSTAYSYHRILLDDGGLPCDFLFLEASPDSVRFSGVLLPAALGRRAGEVLPALAAGGTDWIRRFGEVAMSGRAADFAGEPPITSIPCSLHVYSPQRGYFVILYQPEKALQRPALSGDASTRLRTRILADSAALLVHAAASPAADRSVADTVLRLSGARYAAYQRMDPDGAGFETVAVAGMSADTLAALADLGICLEGRHWRWGPDGAVHIPRQGTVVYPGAAALAAVLLPASLGVLAAGIGTGEAVMAGIPGSDSPAGFFVLLMPDGQSFDGHDLLASYAGQLGTLLARQYAEALLHDLSEARLPEPSEQAKTVFDQSPSALYLIRVLQDGDFRFERVNRAAGLFFTGADPASAVGRSPREVFGADRGERISAHFARCVREEGIVSFEESLGEPAERRVFRTVLSPVIEGGRVACLVGTTSDVTSLRSAEDALRDHLRRNEMLLDLLKHDRGTPDDFLDHTLEQAMVITSSATGGIFLYDETAGCLVMQSLRGGWTDDPEAGGEPPTVLLDQAGLWAEAIRRKRPVLVNDMESSGSPASSEPLPGQPPMHNFLSIPLFDIGRVVAVVGVGNKDGNYTEQDVLHLNMLMGNAWTVAERIRSNTRLRNERDLLRTTLLSIGDGIVATDKEGRVLLLNGVARELTGWKQDDAIGQPLDDVLRFIDEHTREPFPLSVADLSGLAQTLPEGLLLLARDGSARPISDSIAPIHGTDGTSTGIVVAFRDITQERHRQESIAFLSYHDPLTGLYNRRFFEEELRRLNTRRNLPITLVMSDVNGLKLTNDAFGHGMGDRLLRAAADALRAGCREDDIIARMGGDEFVILLPRTTSEEAATVVGRVQELSAATGAGSVTLSISFGWDTKTLAGEDIQETFSRAEDRMYRQKLFEGPSTRSKLVQAIIQALYETQPREEEHSRRVAVLCEGLGKALGLPDHEIKDLRTAGLLHDIGKIAIREDILDKEEILTEEERRDIRRHAEIGYRILSSVNELADVADNILLHHERWDGTGYPKGLQGSLTPISSRIIGLADSYDAMVSERPYRPAMSREEALAVIQSETGTKFDPELVRIFAQQVVPKEAEAV